MIIIYFKKGRRSNLGDDEINFTILTSKMLKVLMGDGSSGSTSKSHPLIQNSKLTTFHIYNKGKHHKTP